VTRDLCRLARDFNRSTTRILPRLALQDRTTVPDASRTSRKNLQQASCLTSATQPTAQMPDVHPPFVPAIDMGGLTLSDQFIEGIC